MPPTLPTATTERDLRLDLFRGLALWLIFLDHIPANIVNWITIRNYGFSRRRRDLRLHLRLHGGLRVWPRDARTRRDRGRRAHPQARLAGLCRAHLHLRDLHGGDRLPHAHVREPALQRRNGRVRLPEAARRHADRRRCCSSSSRSSWMCCRSTSCCCWRSRRCCGCCCAGRRSRLRPPSRSTRRAGSSAGTCPSYPNGVWFFNPFAWQLIFVFGAWCGVGGTDRLRPFLRSRWRPRRLLSPIWCSRS